MNKVHPLIYAHRGMSKYAPENTLTAFKQAFEAGADGIEFDVYLTADDEIVVFHDKSLKRITGVNKNTEEVSLAEIKTLDAGRWFGATFIGESIPTLREVFEILGPENKINIELKGTKVELVEKVLQEIKDHGVQSKTIVSAFNANFLRKIKMAMAEIEIGLLALPSIAGFWHRKITNKYMKPDALHVFYRDVNAKMIKTAHAIGQRVHTYTVNDPVEMANLFSMDIDMIFTDDPALGIEVRKNYSK